MKVLNKTELTEQLRQAEERERKAVEALREITEALGEDHIQLLSFCPLWDHRRSMFEDYCKRYWNHPALASLLPDVVERVKAALSAIPLKPPVAS